MNTGNLLQEIERAAIPTEEKRIIRDSITTTEHEPPTREEIEWADIQKMEQSLWDTSDFKLAAWDFPYSDHQPKE